MQISANNLLQAAQQALSTKPAARAPAAQPFEPMDFAPEATEAPAASGPAASAGPAQAAYQRPGSQVDIKI
jgi:hypothetical protein